MKAKINRKLISVTIDIRHGPASPTQKVVWAKFWQKLIAEVSTNDSFQSQNNIREELRK